MFGLDNKELLLYGGAAVGGIAVLLLLLKLLSRRKEPPKDEQKGLREHLDEYPDPPPAPKGGRRLVIDGIEARVRLVVVAPAGKQTPVDVEDVPELLDDLLRGLGAFVKTDKPRVRVWPPQLSAAGFAPSFFRLVESPDEEGRKSHWVRVAGPIKVGGKLYLLGLALFTEEANKLGTVLLEPPEWVKRVQIEK